MKALLSSQNRHINISMKYMFKPTTMNFLNNSNMDLFILLFLIQYSNVTREVGGLINEAEKLQQ